MKIGDYVRTKDGYICKYTQDNNVLGIETVGNDRYFLIQKSEIVKSSPNIIDLIEVGDYVNGYRITDLDISIGGKTIRLFTDEPDIDAENIKSIVTKEQFESMKYKVGENNEPK